MARTQASFNRLSAEEAAILNSDNLAGALYPESITTTVYNFETRKLERQTFSHVPAMDRVGYELLVNAGDNAVFTTNETNKVGDKYLPYQEWRTPDKGNIKINITPEYLQIENYGLPMPVEPHLRESTPDNVKMVPYLAFGYMNCGTSGDKSVYSITSGKNGIGGKVANFLGSRFILEVGDNIRKQEYLGEWSDRMRTCNKSIASPGYTYNNGKWVNNVELGYDPYTGPAYFRATYFPTQEYGWGNYSDVNIMHFAKTAIEVSLATRIEIKFSCQLNNGSQHTEIFNCKNVERFLEYTNIPSSTPKHSLYLWRAGVEKGRFGATGKIASTATIHEQASVADNPLCVYDFPELEYHIYDTPNNGCMYAITNGMPNPNGGIHVNCLLDKLSKFIVSKTSTINKISTSAILKHVTVIVMARVNNPTFDAQTKMQLVGYNTHTSSLKKSFRIIDNVDFFEKWASYELIRTTELSTLTVLKKLTKKDTKNIEHDKLDDANWAGDKQYSKYTQLSIVEGESAEIFAARRICALPGGRDTGGTYQLRGKILNMLRNSTDKAERNATINGILKALGLDRLTNNGRGYDFTKPEHRDLLRYHSVLLLTDGDLDGYHIRCLVIAFFYHHNPSLIECGFVSYLEVPILKIFKKSVHKPGQARAKDQLLFTAFTENAEDEWQRSNPNMKANIIVKYYKGLGSFSEEDDILDDCGRIITCILDDLAKQYISMAFEDTDPNMKKQWINYFRNSNEESNTTALLDIYKYMKEAYDSGKANVYERNHIGIVLDSINEDITCNLTANKLTRKTKTRGRKAKTTEVPDAKDVEKYSQNYAIRSISNVLNIDLIAYIVASILRSIPCYLDGNKKAHRQAMSHLLAYYKYGLSNSQAKKVVTLSTEAQTRVSYKHGPDSMTMTIVLMAQQITGVKNLSILTREGGFGNRDRGGKNVSISTGRYAKTRVDWWVSYVYNKDIIELIPRIHSEGDKCEELFLPSDVPFELINGADGVGSGYRSKIPLHNPWDVADWLIERCSGIVDRVITPWFKGFSGRYEIMNYDSEIRDKIRNMPISTEEREHGTVGESQNDMWKDFAKKKTGQSLITYGSFSIEGSPGDGLLDIRITELPIGMCADTYVKEWKSKIATDKLLTDVDKKGDTTNVDIRLYGVSMEKLGGRPNHVNLKLVTKFTMSNMNLCDLDGYVVHFNNSGEILEIHYRVMIRMYERMRLDKLDKLLAEINKLTDRYKILYLFKTKVLHADNDDEWDSIIEKNGVNRKAITGIALTELKRGDLNKLQEKIDALVEDRNLIEATSPIILYRRRLEDFKEKVLKVLGYPRNESETSIGSYMHDNTAYEFNHINEADLPSEERIIETTRELWRKEWNEQEVLQQ